MRKTKENEENKIFMKLFGVLDEKKNGWICFGCFQWLEKKRIEKKKEKEIINNEKRKKKWSAKAGWATAQIVLQYRVLYCDLEAAREVKVYYKRCWIVLQHGGKVVLQDTKIVLQ